MNKPHLLILLTQDLQSPSGLGRYFPLAKYLVREEFRVTIIALHSNFEELEEREFYQDGVDVHYVFQMHVRKVNNITEYFSPGSLIKVSLSATEELYKAAWRENPDLILIGKPHPMNGIAGMWLSKRTGVPVIVDCDDYEAESNHTNSVWQKAILKFFENNLPRLADYVFTNTFFMRDHLIAQGVDAQKIDYIPNGVDTERFSEPPEMIVTELSNALGLTGRRVIGYFGSLNLVNHPVDQLLRSFALVSKKIEDARLLIVGGGKDLDYLRAMSIDLGISNKIIFTGRVKPEEMNIYYRLADVSVDPVNDTLADCGRCPLKLFESWQMGVPVVSADVGDRRILMGEEMEQLLAAASDQESLAQVLIKLLSSSEILQKLSVVARNRTKEYDWGTIVLDARKVLECLLKTKKNTN